MKTISVIQIKRGTKANLERILRNDLKPKDGEPIFEIDTGKLKFGDGTHNYIDLEYFKTGDVEVSSVLDGQILVYNGNLNIWEAKQFTDNRSIEYSNSGLKIAGFTGQPDQSGKFPVVRNGQISWETAPTIDTLNGLVGDAARYSQVADLAAGQAVNSMQQAANSAGQAEQFRDATAQLLEKKFWFGTRDEYEAEVVQAGKLTEGTIYLIRDYDWANYPN